jgi:hypothetical protein
MPENSDLPETRVTFMDELNEVVADALRVVAEQRGWLYVRAVRG